MKKYRILFVDDEEAGRKVALYNLREAGYQVDQAESGEKALELFSPTRHDAVITDIRMPGMSGIQLLAAIRKQHRDIPVLVITAYASINSAVEAMKLGAYDFIVKPFNSDQLLLALSKALDHRSLRQENTLLRARLKGIERPILYRSDAMEALLKTVDRVAGSDAPVLITGESGTGKELVARRIHVQSSAADGPFVPVNCAALPAELLEAELFGHTKGAFTGAGKERQGRFRQADSGTIFLDEISEMTAALQAKLLRVLQEGQVDVIGLDKAIPVSVRVVSATNRDIGKLLEQGSFREDLFYRLNVVEIEVPPLRERKEDVQPLVEHYLRVYGEGRELRLSESALHVLENHHWPGNVRELQNICQRLALLSSGEEADVAELPAYLLAKGPDGELGPQTGLRFELPKEGVDLFDLEKDIILRVLELKEWNVSQAAAFLKVPRHVLAYRIEKYGIERN